MDLIEGFNNLDSKILSNNDKIILLYFGAVWCNPCQELKQKLIDEQENLPYMKVLYCDCDCEDNQEILNKYNVKVLPTQIFIHLENNNIVRDAKIEGYDWIKLKMTYDSLLSNRNF